MITDRIILTRITDLLDGCVNMYGKPLTPDVRAVIFEALDEPTGMNWRAARTCYVTRTGNLWKACADTAPIHCNDHPGTMVILAALEQVAYTLRKTP